LQAVLRQSNGNHPRKQQVRKAVQQGNSQDACSGQAQCSVDETGTHGDDRLRQALMYVKEEEGQRRDAKSD